VTAFAFAGALNWPARWYRPDGDLESRDIAHRMVEVLCNGIMPHGAR
jgi:hypothetical protein